jgi:3-hydroxyacyl-CoA dehydrogenase/enoyl-CoA hydratase/3-hydroxybutyryl-CoA epimerase
MSALTMQRQGNVAVVTLDTPHDAVNKVSNATRWELEDLLQRLESDDLVKSIVIRSGKPDIFIAGADIEEFAALRSAEEATRLSKDGQLLMQRIADSSKPFVAAIHGACLGGGLELALACSYRIASDHPKTVLGFPEVQLGLIPGAGGSNRLPRLIGARAALDMILTSRNERGRKALALGLIDELVPQAILHEIAVDAAERLSRTPRSRARRGGSFLLDGTALGRLFIYRGARKAVARKTGGHYPAPQRAIEVVRTSMEHGMARGLEAEAQAFGELAMTDVSRRLVEVFFATTEIKKDDGVPAGYGRARPVRRLGIIGAGFMGSGIAGTAVSRAGVEVRMKDADLAKLGRGLKAATDILTAQLAKRRITRYEYARKCAYLSGSGGLDGFGGADIVVEAVFEELAVKRQVIADIESAVPPTTVIATNTSTLAIHEIASVAQHADRVLGMHFFSPVEKMPLLEVIPTDVTSADAIVTAVQFGRRMGKTVIVVADSPGFWVNRILLPYLNEAGFLLEDGVSIEAIDGAMTNWGFPVGPVALMDEVGLDIGEKAGKVMHQALGDRLRPSRVIGVMRADGRLGRKNARGFYFYKDGHKTGADSSVLHLLGVRPRGDADSGLIEDRLVYAMLNEAARAMSEGVVRTPRDGDIGALFGIGFPAFRGGPLRELDTIGAAEAVARLEKLAATHGPRFEPAPVLDEMARTGQRWYPMAAGR